MNDPKNKKEKSIEDVDMFWLEDQGYWEDPQEDYNAFEDQQVFMDDEGGDY